MAYFDCAYAVYLDQIISTYTPRPNSIDDLQSIYFLNYPYCIVTLAKETGNEYQGCTINIVVSAQAVQVRNNDLDKDGNVITELTAANFGDIKGWPEAAE